MISTWCVGSIRLSFCGGSEAFAPRARGFLTPIGRDRTEHEPSARRAGVRGWATREVRPWVPSSIQGLGTGREGRPRVVPHPCVLLSPRRSGRGVVGALARGALDTLY